MVKDRKSRQEVIREGQDLGNTGSKNGVARLMAQAPGRVLATGWGRGWVACFFREESRVRRIEREARQATPTPPHLQAKEVPGVKVFRSSATMYFANAELYSDSLKAKVRLGSPCLECVREGLTSSLAQSTSLHLQLVSLVRCRC